LLAFRLANVKKVPVAILLIVAGGCVAENKIYQQQTLLNT
jgi:hypothetical protein